jgi:hypothetical protein
MPVKVVWEDQTPEDHEDWEDILRAEYGTAMGHIVFHMERAPNGWRLICVEEEENVGPEGLPRLDQRDRFMTALVAAGKPVVADDLFFEGEQEGQELEAIGSDALNARAEKARRDGSSDE